MEPVFVVSALTAEDWTGNGHEPTGTDTGITIGQPSQADGGLCWSWNSGLSPYMEEASSPWASLSSATIVAAVKSGSSEGNIVEHMKETGSREGYQFGILSGVVRLNLRSTTGLNNINQVGLPGGSDWHMIGSSFSTSNTSEVWLDGVSYDTQGSATPIGYTTTEPLRLGRRVAGGSTVSFNGLLDEVAIFDYKLSSGRHAAYAAALAAGTGLADEIMADAPLAYWRFGDVPVLPIIGSWGWSGVT